MIRLLFVDDEILILEGLRRLLRSRRDEWEMEFVGSGEAALEMMAQKKFDVVITDMRMPGMDGATLLGVVKERQPETVRLILSGQSDSQALLRAFGVSHQYLSKPCDPEVLQHAVDRAMALQSMFGGEAMLHIVKSADVLPSIPAVYQELVATLRSPTASLVDAARIISRDLGMTVAILKMVNTAFFGQPKRIADIERAATILGLNFIMALVLEHGLFAVEGTTRCPGLDLNHLRRHSLRTASVARIIAQLEKISGIRPEDAFLAGVVHDVGKLAAAGAMPDKYAALIRQGTTDGATSISAERKLLGADHGMIGAFLLARWGFDNPLAEAVACHESPGDAAGSGFGLAGMLHIAHAIAEHPDVSDPTDPVLDLQPGYIERMGLTERYAVWREAAQMVIADKVEA